MKFVLVLVLSLGIPLTGCSASPTTANAQADVDPAYALASFLNRDERAEQLWEQLFNVMPALMLESPDTAKLMRDNPELVQKIVTGIRPELTKQVKAKLPILWERIAAVYRQTLTAQESSRLLDYHSSPANVKLTSEMLRRVDMARVVDGGSGQVDARATEAMVTQAYPLALASLSPPEREQVLKFKASGVAAKFAALRNDVAVARASWVAEVEPEILAVLEKEAERVVAERTLD